MGERNLVQIESVGNLANDDDAAASADCRNELAVEQFERVYQRVEAEV